MVKGAKSNNRQTATLNKAGAPSYKRALFTPLKACIFEL